MVSPVDTSVKHFTSSMANAPVLSGTAGTLIALLDATLVSGFDIKTLSGLTVAGGVASAAFNGTHSASVDSVILVAGVSGGPAGFAGLNGEQKVTGVASGVVKFATALPDGTYTGTVTIKMAPAGWEKAFSGTNVAVYRSLDPMSSRHCLRVDDTNAQAARVVGYEAMTDANSGNGRFPTDVQMGGGGSWAKSVLASNAAAAWVLAADARALVLHVTPGTSQSASFSHGATRGFGDAVALRPSGDAFATFLNYSREASVRLMYEAALDTYQSTASTAFPRSFVGVGSAVSHVCLPYVGGNVLSGADPMLGAFPSQVDGSLSLSARFFSSAVGGAAARALLPGLFSVPQSQTFDIFKSGDRVPGTRALAGRTLMALNPAGYYMDNVANSSNAGVSFVDVTGPWR